MFEKNNETKLRGRGVRCYSFVSGRRHILGFMKFLRIVIRVGIEGMGGNFLRIKKS